MAKTATKTAAETEEIPSWKRYKMERKAVTIYMEYDAYERVVKLARADRRTLQMQVVYVIDEYLKNLKPCGVAS